MARYSNVSSNFSGGLISDHLVGRVDVERIANSSRKFSNFFPTVQGPAEYRPGFELITNETSQSFLSNTASASVGIDEDSIFRVVFGATKIKMFSNKGELVDTVDSPYSNEEIKSLSFSSETNKLFIAHPNHKPKTLSGGVGFVNDTLVTLSGENLISSDSFTLNTTVAVEGLGDWTLTDLEAEVEPFLEPEITDSEIRVEKGEEIVKIVSTDAGLQAILDAGSGGFTNFYVEYNLKGATVLGKVVISSANYPEVSAPSVTNGVYTVYVDAVDFISEITAADAKIFLLDNAETTNGSIQEKQLEQDGVPDGEVHLRSDVDIFSNANTGSWIRIGEDNRSNKVLLGADSKFNLTRWVKISEYVGLETHPIEFYRGNQFIEETSQTHDYTVYDNGSVYKAFGDSEFTIEDIVGNTAGEVRDNGNRVFVWNGGSFRGDRILVYNADITRNSNDLHFTIPTGHNIKVGDTINISGLSVTSGTDPNGDQTVTAVEADKVHFVITSLSHKPTGDATLTIKSHDLGTNSIVGNLTTGKSMEVLKCDPAITVQEYNASTNSSGLLVKTTVSNTTVTEIANDIFIQSSEDLFSSVTSIDRHIKGALPSAMVYAKILEFVGNKRVRARLNNTIPRDPVTGGLENKGVFVEFSFGAWYPNNYPKTVAKYEQRRVFGGTYANPNFVFFSRLNSEDNFAPTQDDRQVLDTDGISYGISNLNAAITWLSAGSELTIGTTQGVFRLVTNSFNAAVSPKTVRIELVDDVGCDKQAILAGTSLFFSDESSTEVLEYKFDSDVQSGATNDVAKFVYPTFVKDSVKKLEFQNNPQSRLWVVTKSGKLYVLSYNRQDNFYAWSKQETSGFVKDITVLRKGFDSSIDQVWITVERSGKLYYERLFSEVDSIEEPTVYLDNATVIKNLSLTANHSNNVLTIETPNKTLLDRIDVVVDSVYLGNFTVGTISDSVGVQVPYVTDSEDTVKVEYGTRYTGIIQSMYPQWNAQNKPAFGAETARIISQKVFTIDSHKFKHGVEGRYDTVKLPGNTFPTNPELGTLTPYTGFDRERPVRNSQFGVEKLPELVQDEPYKTVFGSLVTKTDLN